MLPTLQNVFSNGIPTLEEIQTTIEELWANGFNERGRNLHNGKLKGKKGTEIWIGDSEVCSYLKFVGVDAAVVHFTSEELRKEALGKFAYAYFSNGSNGFSCGCCGDCRVSHSSLATTNVSSRALAQSLKLLHSSSHTLHPSRCNCSLPPLYLQWQGHSVTIVGVRKNTLPGGLANFTLLSFCPQKLAKPGEMKSMLRERLNGGQIVNAFKDTIEIPPTDLWGKVSQKECRVVLSTVRVISERSEWKVEDMVC